MKNDYIRRDKTLLAYLSAEAYAQLQRVPAADVVEVRCRDCRYGSECLMEVFQCKLTCRMHSADWFCADGKRKKREGER